VRETCRGRISWENRFIKNILIFCNSQKDERENQRGEREIYIHRYKRKKSFVV